MKMLVLARFTFREAARKKAVLGAAILTGVFLALYALGTFFAFNDLNRQVNMPATMRRGINGELLLAGVYFVNFIAGLLAIFSAVGTVSSEIDQGTLHAIVPKPIRRWELVVGKWLGFASMLTTYVTLTTGAAIAIVYAQSGFLPPDLWQGLAVMVIGPLLLLSLTMLGSTTVSTVANGIIVFMMYALALAGGRLEQLGTLIRNQTLIDIGIATSLVVPTDALWRKVSSLMGGGGVFTGSGAAQPGLFSVVDPPSLWMIVYAAAYAVVTIVAAIAVFQRRDL